MPPAWESLLETPDGLEFTSPWLGTGNVSSICPMRNWWIEGPLPDEIGWHRFCGKGRSAIWTGPGDPADLQLPGHPLISGYLAADRFIPEKARVTPDPAMLIDETVPVHLVEPGLDRFARCRVFCIRNHAWIYLGQLMDAGPEDQVRTAFIDRLDDLNHIQGVTPALDLAFRFASWRRQRLEERRAELERQRVEEERRRAAMAALGSATGRRELAATGGEGFHEAAQSALRLSGAELLDTRPSRSRGEMVVQFRLNRRRFECTCQRETLRIIDSGICLRNELTGERGDTRFTLETLPGVILQAQREGRLVVFRHVE